MCKGALGVDLKEYFFLLVMYGSKSFSYCPFFLWLCELHKHLVYIKNVIIIISKL